MNDTTIYVAGGTVQAGGGIYLERAADSRLLELCRQGAFAFVLTSRQMGKSSLMVRTAEKLSGEIVRSVIVDLTELGVDVTADQWYKGFVLNLEDQLGLRTKAARWWDEHKELGIPQRFTLFLRKVVLSEVAERVAIFVDEIDTTLRLSFTDDFFTAIRYLYNARADSPELARLSFVLIGVATPGDLIKDPERTPFNIGHRVELTDFTPDEARQLLVGIPLAGEEAERVLRRVLSWTGGHPYLTLRLFRSFTDNPPRGWSDEAITQRVEELYFGRMREQDSNLQFVRDMLTKKAFDPDAVLETYRDIRRGRKVPDEDLSLVKSWLKLSGIVCPVGGLLRVRNKVYETVFSLAWVRQHLRINWPRMLARLSQAIVLVLVMVALPLAWFAERQKSVAEQQTKAARMSLTVAIEEQKIAESQKKLAASAAAYARNQQQLAMRFAASALAEQHRATAAAADAQRQKQSAEKLRSAADEQRRQAEALKELSLARGLTAQASFLRNSRTDRFGISTLLAIEAMRRLLALPAGQKVPAAQARPAAEQILRESQSLLPELAGRRTLQDSAKIAALSLDGSRSLLLQKGVYLIQDNETGKVVKLASNIPRLSFSPDGRRLFGYDGIRLSLWDAETGREMTVASDARSIAGKNQAVLTRPSIGRSSLRAEGNNLILSGPSVVQVWRLDNGKQGVQIETRDTSRLLAIDAMASRLAILGPNGKVSIWSSKTQESSPFDVAEGAVAAAFTADGGRLAAATPETLTVWDSSGEELWQVQNREVPSALTFSPDGKWLLAASQNGTVRVCDVTANGNEVASLSHDGPVEAMVFSRRGDRLATLTAGKIARVWQTDSWEELARLGYESLVGFSPDGGRLVTIRDATMEVWTVGPREGIVHLDSTDTIGARFFSRDGRRSVDVKSTGEDDDVVEVLDAASGKAIAAWRANMKVVLMEISSNGKRALAQSSDYFRVWDVDSKSELAAGSAADSLTTLSADGQSIAITRLDHVEIREIPGNRLKSRIDAEGAILVEFSPDGRRLAIRGLDAVQVWDIAQGRRLAEIRDVEFGRWPRFSPDGRWLAIPEGSIVQLWEVGTPAAKLKLVHDGEVNDLAFSHGGQWLVTGSHDTTARVWEVASAKEVARASRPSPIQHVAFTLDNRELVLIDAKGQVTAEPWIIEDLISLLCKRLHRNLDPEKEWDQYLAGEPYCESCPGLSALPVSVASSP
jgi:WD40 repeat protein